MLVVSTMTFALCLIALVLETSLAFQNFARELSSSNSSLWSTHRTNIVVALCATITYLVVSGSTLRSSFFDLMCPPIYSFYSLILSVCGERLCCGIMIGGSLRSSHFSSSEQLVSPHLSHLAVAINHEFFFPNYVLSSCWWCRSWLIPAHCVEGLRGSALRAPAPQHAERTQDHADYRSSTPKGAPVQTAAAPALSLT
jgi:hypothetical protein